ncbi:MAG: two-component system, LytTR family, sensor kinase [Sphingomonadales bacterium]|jgi:LytS/YehU family sensor histidine kinase|nr:two-component system, LytTR family, sensor kinase [Sphingomonadales bacterium]
MDDARSLPVRARLADLPLAAASIGGFWLFYFATIVVRTAIIDQEYGTLSYSALGCLIGLFVTFLVWIVLARAARESVRIQVVAAAIACIPAAAIFSTFNLAFAVHQPLVARTVITEHQGNRTIVKSVQGDELSAPNEVHHRLAAVPEQVLRQRVIRLIADGLVTWYFFFAAWASFYIAMSSANRLRTAERRFSRAEREAQAAQLRALRYQVNPHFLFNTLNSLSSLVMARREDEAERMIVNLSTFFRSSLALDPSSDVTLDEELQFQRLYLDIETLRFPNRLKVRIEVPPDLGTARLPPLLLQPLVENAIKHGVARTVEPVHLTIAAREEDARLILTVENDRGPVAPGGETERGTGVGLANVRERLGARFGRAADCEAAPLPGGGYLVTLSMPLETE